MFKPGTRYASVCADVVVMGKNAIQPHKHTIPSVSEQSEEALNRLVPIPLLCSALP